MPAWPLPNKRPLLAGYAEQGPAGNLVRTQMDVGPAKVRRRGSVGVREIAVGFVLTPNNVATFVDWFQNDIGSGAEAFDFVDVRTEATLLCRFKGEPAYSLSPISTDLWSMEATLEILPQ